MITLPLESRLIALPPLALYIHIPWCVKKCPYCDFNSHTARDALPEARYIEALTRDLESALPLIWGRGIHSIFFGGGTPSLFSAAGIDAILSMVRTLTKLDHFAEITLEANPGTVEAEKFAGFKAAGVNRLSLGIQSFDPGHLRALGRIHDAQEAHRAAEIAASTFDNFNLDLMYALPGQTLQQAQRDVDTALNYAPPHLSCYHLTLEPNTPFHAAPPPLPDDDLSADMQMMVEATLAAAGYQHYETSAFARPRRQCRHNLNYWQFGDYLGIGAGAHGKLSFHDRILRQMRHKHPREYMEHALAGTPVQSEHGVARADLAFEFMMNALRLTGGFDTALFTERTGLPITAAQTALDEGERRGLIVRDHLRIAPTQTGRRFLNDLLGLFLP
ncbi:coproporphyrinogen III oxidase [Sulfuriferula plumbiphila]|uniref:Heme chaperone HemW n=1 Tax=Sulfuriferula plumbiphila TaxID=171865 RepID=A0A512L4Q6_9PROT|nr:radical SAM family heme chaperone HemW [Sulfuriferula plumbiphila]BBP03169.1 coproporphyrinogen III oxidase [Sulfuriferula plumbiphila]GEP29456.1 coproporphyrinogen III oxidase [Sulfuriferula plumbiphila]